MSRARRTIALAAALSALLVLGPADATPVTWQYVNAPSGAGIAWTAPVFAMPAGDALEYTNIDAVTHNFIAFDAYGSDSQPWCTIPPGYPAGRCPLFWSETIGLAQTTSVLGIELIEPGKTYTFWCDVHPLMKGTLVALPNAG